MPPKKRVKKESLEEPSIELAGIDHEASDKAQKPAKAATNKGKAKEDKKKPSKTTAENADSPPSPVLDEPSAKEKKPRSKKSEPEEQIRMRNRSVGMLIGAHVSMAKSIANSVTNANHIGCNAFAMFLKNQRKWVSPDMKSEDIEDFKTRMKELDYDGSKHVLPHGSYLINLAQDETAKQDQAYECFLDDLKRCELLGIGRYNFHPGSTASCTREKGIQNVAKCINKAIEATSHVRIVIENMAGHGNIIGGPLEELAEIISQVEKKDRVGVCLDTCRECEPYSCVMMLTLIDLFAAGHDLRTQEAYDTLMQNFDKIVGMQYLAGMHLNDSKADLGANKDLHQNIGLGYLGLEPFRCIMNDRRLEGLPLVLETPSEDENKKEDKRIWAREIELLEWLIGKAADDPEVLAKAAELYSKGESDREKALGAAQRKAAKATKALEKANKVPGAAKSKKRKEKKKESAEESE